MLKYSRKDYLVLKYQGEDKGMDTYQVLARKYRPQTFAEIVGQKTIVKKLQQAITSSRIPHAFLFAGPRGVGKTTMARIFAKALNCIEGPAIEPCNRCVFCLEITDGTSMDFLEIDGASNRGIEEIRSLRESALLRPAKARYKIYLIDEVHMLTNEAFNALLKLLEEPPEYVKFIFATTSPEKIPATIVSRCQHYDFKPLKYEEIEDRIKQVLQAEKYSIESDAMKKLIEAGAGSLRDILGYLDQMIILSKSETITSDITQEVLGLPSGHIIWDFLKNLAALDKKSSILLLHKMISEGKDITNILGIMARKVQLIIWNKLGIDVIDEESDKSNMDFFNQIPVEILIKGMELIMQTKEKIRYEPFELILAELLCFNLIDIFKPSISEQKKIHIPEGKQAEPSVPEKQPNEQSIPISDSSAVSSSPLSLSNNSFDEITQKWEMVLSEVKKKKPTVQAALREGKPVKFENGCIYIVFGQDYAFHCNRVMDNKAIIEKILEKIFGNHYTINCLISTTEKKIPLKEKSEIKEIINFFGGGEIIESEG